VSEILQPLNRTEEFLAAVLKELIKVNSSLIQVASELQKLNQSATQKQPIQVQLDAMRLSEAIDAAQAKRAKSQMKR
jgi:hypothetical protein